MFVDFSKTYVHTRNAGLRRHFPAKHPAISETRRPSVILWRVIRGLRADPKTRDRKPGAKSTQIVGVSLFGDFAFLV
jgi:hypothetical protein